MRTGRAALLLTLWLASADAHAQASVALDQLDPAVAGDAFLSVPSPWAPGHLVPRAMVMVDWSLDPLVVVDDGGAELGAIVSSQVFLRADVTLSLWDRLLVAADFPVAVQQSGDDPVIAGAVVPSPDSAGIGDLRLGVRARLYGEYREPFQVGLGGYVYVPTGTAGSYISDASTAFKPHASLGGRASRWFVWSASGGTLLRTSDGPHLVTFGAGAAVVLLDGMVQLGPEAFGAVALDDAVLPGAPQLTPSKRVGAEGLLGGKLRWLDFTLGLGAGTGLSSGVGTPTFRGIASIAYAPEPEEDAAGMPAAAPLDSDRDGIADAADRCPALAGVAANGGCPPDHDGDGIADAADRCPALAGVAANGGCPPDHDGDGIADSVDGCPALAGVPAAEPARNGCPPDQDGDGIADSVDGCPALAGVQAAEPARNGCPLDQDGDGIVDSADACPHERGADDADPAKRGCPRLVRVTEEEIVILQQVQFRFAGGNLAEAVDPVSEALLDEVRTALEDHAEITKIEVQGHTDNAGSPPFNVRLSQQRADAVRDWLVARGIPADKLVAKGYGQSVPLESNRTEAGRQKNRRVQFKIVARAP